jgi:16S rRNA processing protein RimM
VSSQAEPNARRILVGAIAGAHGVRGEVTIKSFTADPRKIAAYGPLFDEDGGREFKLNLRGQVRGLVIARIEGIADRNAAEALKGLRLYAPRAKFPRTKGEEFYLADLVGLRAEGGDGAVMGQVKALHNFGAGDMVEIEKTDGATFFVPFTKAAVPVVDLDGGRIVVVPPPETEAKPDGADED